jgi:hypothetical protein
VASRPKLSLAERHDNDLAFATLAHVRASLAHARHSPEVLRKPTVVWHTPACANISRSRCSESYLDDLVVGGHLCRQILIHRYLSMIRCLWINPRAPQHGSISAPEQALREGLGWA